MGEETGGWELKGVKGNGRQGKDGTAANGKCVTAGSIQDVVLVKRKPGGLRRLGGRCPAEEENKRVGTEKL